MQLCGGMKTGEGRQGGHCGMHHASPHDGHGAAKCCRSMQNRSMRLCTAPRRGERRARCFVPYRKVVLYACTAVGEMAIYMFSGRGPGPGPPPWASAQRAAQRNYSSSCASCQLLGLRNRALCNAMDVQQSVSSPRSRQPGAGRGTRQSVTAARFVLLYRVPCTHCRALPPVRVVSMSGPPPARPYSPRLTVSVCLRN